MDPDKYQQAWQAHSSQIRVKIYDELLLKELQYDIRFRQAVPFWISCILLGTAPLMLMAYWIYTGPRLMFPWYRDPFYWIIGWMVVSSLAGLRRSLAQQSDVPESLVDCLKDSLKEVEREIRGTDNSWKWILQVTLLTCAFFFYIGGSSAVPVMIGTVAIMAADYFLIQFFGRLTSESRRKKYSALLTSLTDETYHEDISNPSKAESTSKSGTLFVVSLCGIAVLWVAMGGQLFESSYAGTPKSNGPGGAALADVVTHQRREKKLVSLAAMVMVDGQVVAAAVDGERLKGRGVSVELTDCWHIGGVAKSITATMIARLVESGRMNWSDTLGERFPDASIHEDWKAVTLKQLLTDTAGAPENFSYQVRLKNPPAGPECTAERYSAVMDVIAEKPVYLPGRKFSYSNVGCTIAAVMAEAVTKVSWEDLVKREVFEPLALADAGFGPPESPFTTLDQPRGHRVVHGWKIGMDDKADNTSIMAPSGSVHMTLNNLCTYAFEHLRGERGEGKLLTSDVYKVLHTPELSSYACGWLEKRPTFQIPHKVYWHNGSNTMWYTLVVFIPAKNMVVAVTSNDGDFREAETAAWKVVEASANQHNVEIDAALRKALPSAAYPKKSPFNAVIWKDSLPEVRVGEEWFQLLSIDGVDVGDIVAFCRRKYGQLWQKRFEEDLVEVLVLMEHEPKGVARLLVRSHGGAKTQTLDAPMTEENRRAIRSAATKR